MIGKFVQRALFSGQICLCLCEAQCTQVTDISFCRSHFESSCWNWPNHFQIKTTLKWFIVSAWFTTDNMRVWELEKSTSFSPFSNLDKSSQRLGWELRTKLLGVNFGVVLFMSIFSKSLHLVAKFTLSRAASDIVQLYRFNSRPKMKKEKKH